MVNPKNSFHVGDKVRVLAGAFAGMSGVIAVNTAPERSLREQECVLINGQFPFFLTAEELAHDVEHDAELAKLRAQLATLTDLISRLTQGG